MRILPLALMGLAFLSIPACSGNDKVELFRREILESRELDKTPALDVRIDNGSVTVRAWDNPGLKIRAIVRATSNDRAQSCKISSKIENDTLNIKIIWPEGGRLPDERCNITVNLPYGNSTHIAAKNGDIKAQHLEGSLTIAGTNARVEVNSHEGDVTISNTNGNISCQEIQGKFTARNTNGYVKVIGVQDDVKIETSNERIELVCYPTFDGTVDINATNTGIQMTVGNSQVGEFTLETTNATLAWDLGSRGQLIANPSENKAVIAVGSRRNKSRIRTSNDRIKLIVL